MYLEQWLTKEKQWMKEYRKKVLKSTFTKAYPISLAIMAVLWCGVSVLAGGIENLWIGLVVTVGTAVFLALILLLALLPMSKPKRLVKFIKKGMKRLGMSENEQEQLAREMLEAAEDPQRVFRYEMKGPASRMPQCFTMSPHYAYLKGSYPLAILVRMSDVAEVVTERQRKMTVYDPAQNGAWRSYPAFVIGFYYKRRTKKDLAQPDVSLIFYDEGLRNKVLEMITYLQEK